MEDRASETAEGGYETNLEEDPSSALDTDGGPHSPVRPLIVVRDPRPREVALEALTRGPQFIQQHEAVRLYAHREGAPLKRGAAILRSNAIFMPERDAVLIQAVELARDGSVLVIDDLFRLIDCREHDRAVASFQGLAGMDPCLYSISHGRKISEMSVPFLVDQIRARVFESQVRSRSVKRGLTRHAGDPPARKVIESAVRAKKHLADLRATVLIAEIERVRAGMPEETRSNRTAIADALNAAGVATPSRKAKWQDTTVSRVLNRRGRSLDD